MLFNGCGLLPAFTCIAGQYSEVIKSAGSECEYMCLYAVRLFYEQMHIAYIRVLQLVAVD